MKAKRSIESVYLLKDHLATRESVVSFVQAKQLNILVPERRLILFIYLFILITQEAYSVQKYVKHLQDTLDILYEEVSF